VIETDVLKAVVNTAAGAYHEWELKQYRDANKEEVGVMVLWLSSPARRSTERSLSWERAALHPLRPDEPRTSSPDHHPTETALRNLAAVEFHRTRIHPSRQGQKSQTLVLTYTDRRHCHREKPDLP